MLDKEGQLAYRCYTVHGQHRPLQGSQRWLHAGFRKTKVKGIRCSDFGHLFIQRFHDWYRSFSFRFDDSFDSVSDKDPLIAMAVLAYENRIQKHYIIYTYIWKASSSSVHSKSRNLQPASAICASSGRSWKSLYTNELNRRISSVISNGQKFMRCF